MHERGSAEEAEAAEAPPGEPARGELRRNPEDGVLTGVCSGLGAYTGIDPVVWRTGFFVTVFAGGTGLWLYLAAWAMMRDAKGGAGLAEQLLNRALDPRTVPTLLGAGLALAVLLSLPGGGVSWGTLVLAVPLILALLAARSRGVDLGATIRALPEWLRSSDAPPERSEAAPEPSFYHPGDPWTAAPEGPVDMRLVGGGSGGADPGDTRSAATPGAAVPEQRRRRPALAPISLLAILVAIGAAFALHGQVSGAALLGEGAGTVFVGSTIVIIAVGLIASAWFGSGRGLVSLGTLAVLLAVATVAVDLTGIRVGEETWHPASVAEVEEEYRLTVGSAVLDLTDVELEPGEELDVAARIGVGDLEVLLPAEAGVQVQGQVGLGDLHVEETTHSGISVDQDTFLDPVTERPGEAGAEEEAEGETDAPPTIELDARSHVGEVRVQRDS